MPALYFCLNARLSRDNLFNNSILELRKGLVDEPLTKLIENTFLPGSLSWFASVSIARISLILKELCFLEGSPAGLESVQLKHRNILRKSVQSVVKPAFISGSIPPFRMNPPLPRNAHRTVAVVGTSF